MRDERKRTHLEILVVLTHERPQLPLRLVPLSPPDELEHVRLAPCALTGRRR